MAKNKEKEEVKSYTFHLRCSKCAFKFSIERPFPDMNKIDITKMRCMECNSPVQWDTIMFPSGAKPSMEAQAKMNIEASKMALEMAAKQKQIDAEMGKNKMVPVSGIPQKGFVKPTEMIPEKVIKDIEKKVGPKLEEIEKE